MLTSPKTGNRAFKWTIKPAPKAAALGLLLSVACLGCNSQTTPEGPDLLLGSWKVINIARNGGNVGGPGFKGTTYVFRENGTVFSETATGDTVTSKFAHRGDSLIYFSPELTETYFIDSLSQTRLEFTAPNAELGDIHVTLKRIVGSVGKSQ